MKTSSALTTLLIHGRLSDAAAEALGAALKTNATLTTSQIQAELSDAADEAQTMRSIRLQEAFEAFEAIDFKRHLKLQKHLASIVAKQARSASRKNRKEELEADAFKEEKEDATRRHYSK